MLIFFCFYFLIPSTICLSRLAPSTAAIYIVPIGMIQAITNRQVGLKCVYYSMLRAVSSTLTRTFSVITELIVGFLIPGRPIAMMMCDNSLHYVFAVVAGWLCEAKVEVLTVWIL